MFNKTVTLSADGATAAVTDASITDVVTTLAAADSGVTGYHGFFQKAALIAGGAMASNKLHTGRFVDFKSKV